MTNKRDTKLADLEWFPRKYAQRAGRAGISNIGDLYLNYADEIGRAAVILGISDERVDDTLEPLMRKVEEYLGPEIVKKRGRH